MELQPRRWARHASAPVHPAARLVVNAGEARSRGTVIGSAALVITVTAGALALGFGSVRWAGTQLALILVGLGAFGVLIIRERRRRRLC